MCKYNKKCIPSESEQVEAYEYVVERDIIRPDTSYKRALLYVLSFILIVAILSVLVYSTLKLCGVFNTQFVLNIIEHTGKVWFRIIYYSVFFIISLFIVLKRALIGLVRLYQRYASEKVRRKCLFKPTCSEYMILALQKYGLVIGLIKSLHRMFIKCRDTYYRIDYP